MTQEEKYKDALERAKKLQETCDSTAVVGWCEYLFPELKESEDERIRKAIISCCIDHGSKYKYLGVSMEEMCAWLEKLGKQKTDPCTDCTNDKGCVTCEHGELRETHTRILNADEVIAWLVCNIIDFEDYVRAFKKDFGL